ncbi:MAG TPA: acyl-CoA dehydrogenase family protein [Aquihabitans sp.]|jgi:alkylation response protein AidB-like acyl-CoA dehydrogenase|nr:acyl-CoA dehydrogenase family protein [Aquihabitans sp.]
MDLSLTAEQTAIRDLAARILGEQLTPERLREIERSDAWFAADTWTDLAKADLLGLCLPEAHGGGGYGFFELALLLEQVGRAVAPLPVLPTLALGALPIAEFGSEELQARWLPGVAAGEVVLTAALSEGGDGLPPEVPATTANADGDGWRLTGTKHLVPAAELAMRVLVPARTSDGRSTVFLVDPTAAGVALERNLGPNLEPLSTLTLDGVQVGAADVLGAVDGGADVVAWTADRGVAAHCAVQAGVCEMALRTTATYVSERKQFDTPIATFQAVAQRAADAYIDTEAVRVTAYQAAWRLGEGRPAAEELAIAKFWAAEGAHRVVHAAQHLHGGIGVDVDYPVHRAFRWAKHVELSLGGGTTHLRRLGALLAAS